MEMRRLMLGLCLCGFLCFGVIAVALAAPPYNDEVSGADLLELGSSKEGTTVGATTSWPVSREGEGETPTEGEGETPTEGEGEAPTEGEGEAPTEGEGEAPVEGETPTEGEGETPVEGETPTEGEGEPPVEGEGEIPGEGEGETPTEGEDDSLAAIALLGSNLQLECNVDAFVDPGVVAVDDDGSTPVGDIDIAIRSDAWGNTTAISSAARDVFEIEYSMTSTSGVSRSVTRRVDVVDNQAPVIALLGKGRAFIHTNVPYVESGIASVTDICEGDLSETLLFPEGIVVHIRRANQDLLETSNLAQAAARFNALVHPRYNYPEYFFEYRIPDSSGNIGTIQRRVSVSSSRIVLRGEPTVFLECAGASFAEPGVIAVDDDGNTALSGVTTSISSASAGAVDEIVTENTEVYAITYSVVSSAGVPVHATRTVNVVDSEAPQATLAGNNKVLFGKGKPYVEDGILEIWDSCEGDLSGLLSTPESIAVKIEYDDQKVEVYSNLRDAASVVNSIFAANNTPHFLLSYIISDSSGNNATVQREVDASLTAVHLLGEVSMALECNNSTYAEPGYAGVDDDGITPLDPLEIEEEIVSALFGVMDKVYTLVPDTYTITYSALSSAGIPAVSVRTVNIVDDTAPTVTLLGEPQMMIGSARPYVESGIASITDVCDGDLSGLLDAPENISVIIRANNQLVSVSNLRDVAATLNALYPTRANTFSYILEYRPKDASGNSGFASRTVNISQARISLLGAASSTLECSSGAYTDPGFVALDDDGTTPLTGVTTTIVGALSGPVGSVQTGVVDTYTIAYAGTSGIGNALSAVRTVTVKDQTAPVLTLNGGDTSVNCGQLYNDLGLQSVIDVCNGDLLPEEPEDLLTIPVRIYRNAVLIYTSNLQYMTNFGCALGQLNEAAGGLPGVRVNLRVEYAVKDRANNEGKASRNVTQQACK